MKVKERFSDTTWYIKRLGKYMKTHNAWISIFIHKGWVLLSKLQGSEYIVLSISS
jgi:hypothetical protein